MRKQLDKLGKVKQGLHAAQAAFIFIAWALTLAVLTKAGGIGGQTWFLFVLCFITVPALVYQVMVPIYPRAERLANVYAYASIDILFALLWFSASIAVAAWNAAGISLGKSDQKDSDGTCNYFGFGSAAKCTTSKATVGFGLLIFFLFAATATISVCFCRQYRETGVVPGIQEGRNTTSQTDDRSKDIWSTSIEERDQDGYDEPDARHKYGQISDEDEDGQGLLQEPTSFIMPNSTGPHSGMQMRHEPTSDTLHSAHQNDSYMPNALKPGGYSHDTATAYQGPPQKRDSQGNISFPSARYDRI